MAGEVATSTGARHEDAAIYARVFSARQKAGHTILSQTQVEARLAKNVRLGSNDYAFVGGFRMWCDSLQSK
jgi:hypothetical protein